MQTLVCVHTLPSGKTRTTLRAFLALHLTTTPLPSSQKHGVNPAGSLRCVLGGGGGRGRGVIIWFHAETVTGRSLTYQTNKQTPPPPPPPPKNNQQTNKKQNEKQTTNNNNKKPERTPTSDKTKVGKIWLY